MIQTLSLPELQGVLLFSIIILIFAWQGHRNGMAPELVKLGLIALSILVGNPAILGNMVISVLNNFYQAFSFLAKGGLVAIASGNFTPESMTAIFAQVAADPPLIPTANRSLALFLLMLLLVAVGYFMASKIKKKGGKGIGLLLGVVSGMVISYQFLPLLPRTVPLNVLGIEPTVGGLASGLLTLTFAILATPLLLLYDALGTWSIAAIIVVVVLYSILNLRRA